MPRFFFNLYDDIESIDEEGVELVDGEAARKFAERSAREMACHEVMEGHLNLSHRIEVVDEGGAVIETVRFEDVVRLEA